MAKVILGKRPKNFAHLVKFVFLDGSEGEIKCTFKYRTKVEFGEFIDRVFSESKDRDDAKSKGKTDFSSKKLFEDTTENNGKYLLDILDDWDVDAALDIESATSLANELPQAASAIMDAYRNGCVAGRLEN